VSWLVRWRLALRIARRDAARHRARTVLVLAMVGLPVLAVVAADTLFRTAELSPVEQLDVTLGAADAQIVGVSREPVYADPETGALWGMSPPPAEPWTADEVAAALPAGSRVAETVEGRTTYRTDVGRADVAAVVRDADDPLLEGTLDLEAGRLPTGDDEVAVSRPVADRGFAVGDTMELTADSVPARVVGVVRPPAGNADPFVVLPPSSERLISSAESRFLVGVPGGLDWPSVRALNQQGLAVVSKVVAADPPPPAEWLPPDQPPDVFASDPTGTAVMALVVASVVLEVILLAGPAFAVAARTQRRELALVAAAGGAPADLRRVVLAGGVVLGGGAALLGAGLGIAAAAAGIPLVEGWTGRTLGPFEVPLLDVVATVVVGLVAGLGAAYVPARQAARLDVVDTLAGRRGRVRTSWRSPVLGLLLAGAGMTLVVAGARGTALAVAGGAVLLVLGLVAAAPWLIGLLAPLGRRLPVAGRLAVRDATRNRGRTAPALAAVMATVAGVTALSIGSASDSAQSRRDYVGQAPLGAATVTAPGLGAGAWDNVEALLRRQDPDRPVHRIDGVSWTGSDSLAVLRPGCDDGVDECRWWAEQLLMVLGGGSEIAVVTPEAARALTPGAAGDEAARVLAGGRAAVFAGASALDDGSVTLAGLRYGEIDTASGVQGSTTLTGTAALPAAAVEVPSGVVLQLPGTVLVPPQLADRLPIEVTAISMVAGGPDTPVTAAQEEELRAQLGVLAGVAAITVERGFQDDLALARYVLFGLAALLVLVATLTATGLALTDARPDFATLAAVGATPRTRRSMAMASAAVVGGGGAVLGVLAGLGPGIAVAYPLTAESMWGSGGHPLIDVPWLLLAGVAILVPLLAVAVTGLVVRSRLPMVERIA
jgi:putative ABC transport system permease protein